MARTSITLRVLNSALYVIAILTGFASVYPVYSAYQLLEHATTVASPLSSLLAAVVLLGISGLAYLGHTGLDRYIGATHTLKS